MLSQRLDKLESDIQFLIAMHDLLLQNETDCQSACKSTLKPDEIPERDVTHQRNKKSGKLSTTKPPNVSTENPSRSNNVAGAMLSNDNVIQTFSESVPLEGIGNTAIKITQDLENEKQILKEQIAQEKTLRSEVEHSAKQVEDDLCREKEMKESLLLGTMKLKSLVHEYDSKTSELTAELSESRAEAQRLACEVESLSEENYSIIQRLKHLCQELGVGRDEISDEFDFHRVRSHNSYFSLLKQHVSELIKRCNGDNTNANEQVRRLSDQVNTTVGRCAKLEKERDGALKELGHCQDRENHLKHQLHISQVALTTTESELLKKQIEYECTIQKLKAESQIDKDKARLKISEYCSVIQRTKELLISLRNERDASRKGLEETRSKNHTIHQKLKVMEADKQTLLLEMEKLRGNVCDLTHGQLEKMSKLQDEKQSLETSLKKSQSEKKRCIELLNEMKHQLVSLRRKYEHDIAMTNVEKEKTQNESKRLDENFRVLQKISEDQGHTIQKLRSDLEDMKNCNFKLEAQVREMESNENVLIRKLEQSDKQCEKYIRHIDELEDKVERYKEDMRSHDCDDYSDSKYKKKLTEVDELFQRKNREWHEAQRELEQEKDEAISTARKALQKTEELQHAHESQVSELKTKFKAEIQKLQSQQVKQITEQCTKTRELQSELDRIKLSSSQIQRALSTKIQQLQAALSICLGGGSSSNQNNNSTLGLGPLLHHHHHPVAAFGNNGNPGCSNANNNTCANLLNPTTCFGVNGCAAGPLLGSVNESNSSGVCSTTGLFGVDVVGNLIL
ncbi:Leucine-rich repeat and coiled-coil domain-containing protein 1 [Orchesella cincta]|uniref:Leucine-rich repeat and coiled-coil domain-containing protein 1 n=1 Tax=Orchesella cincta TaxID=48709 RepID=A0A1D2NHH5_ORCCI|nr:Leucine-rich repeat and coiled-coil domain-containing protein 1 [Orchesella cincta]